MQTPSSLPVRREYNRRAMETAPVTGPTFTSRPLWALTLGAFALVVGAWLALTPPGLLGKADAVGYAICHRIDLRSFHIGDRAMPLCARCTGIYLGALFGVVAMALMGRARAGYIPATPVLIALVGFIGAMGVDGANSYASLFPNLPHLYEPQNWLRMVTGTFNGLAVGALIYPVFNQTLWRDWQPRAIVGSFRELAVLVAVGVAIVAATLTENPMVLYPLALLSAAGVVALLTMLYTVGLLILTRRENRAGSWRTAALPLLMGLTLALLQIAVIDAGRFWLFGSWEGFNLSG
ncbi:MAG: DUF2085 domain-containing protein [Anaerolineales bacterium]